MVFEKAGLGRDAGGGTRGRMDNLRSGGDTTEGSGVGGRRGLR